MSRQLTFDLPPRAAMARDDFFVSSANAIAIALIDAWRDWPHGKLILTGAAGAGKTHLVHVWAAQSGAVIVPASDLEKIRLSDLPPALALEDCEDIASAAALEETLFHLHNAAQAAGIPLLLTARIAPSRWGLRLPDLVSRLAQAGLAHVDPPDDQLLAMILMKQAADRNIALTPTMIQYVITRVPRSFSAVSALVQHIDEQALSQKKQVNMTHIRMALAEVPDDPSS